MEQADADAVKGRIHGTLDYGDLADCDLVIEAITEDLDQKLEMWKEVDGIVKDDAYFATNTSSLPVADQAAATKRPDKFLGLHFFNPPQMMPLLEVVRAEASDDDAVELGFKIGEELGKTNVAAGDNRGFIVNRLLVPYMLDAIRALEQGVGSIEDIDHGDDGRRQPPDGPADAGRLRRPRHPGLDRRGDGRRLRRGPLLRRPRHCKRWSMQGLSGANRGGGSTITQVRSLLRLISTCRHRTSRSEAHFRSRMAVDETSLERIRKATFPSSRRGYDKREVEKFLNRLADWLETGGGDQARSDTVRRELERVGQRTGSILAEAEESAQQIRDEAEQEAQEQMSKARAEADQARKDAEGYAAEARATADTYSKETRAEADSYNDETRRKPSSRPARRAPRPSRTPMRWSRPRRPRPAAPSRRASSAARTSRL